MNSRRAIDQCASINSSSTVGISGISLLYGKRLRAIALAARHRSVRYWSGLILQSGIFLSISRGRRPWLFLASMWAPFSSNVSTIWEIEKWLIRALNFIKRQKKTYVWIQKLLKNQPCFALSLKTMNDETILIGSKLLICRLVLGLAQFYFTVSIW